MGLVIEVDKLSFRYPKQTDNSLTDINLQIEAGTRFGLFGPNGAGKTTLMSILTGLLTFKEGSIKLSGNEMCKMRNIKYNNLFGFVPQDFSFYQELSPIENFNFFGAWYGLSKLEIKKEATSYSKS